uniref:Uncharacterized protein n=1 Tax=Rousettus aegyptiacus TaxID=9407 RepID=A0A7J8JFM9_ROUAE|nr:hypothetical protein HJG63_010066 [Rousettus aegyptiacus]
MCARMLVGVRRPNKVTFSSRVHVGRQPLAQLGPARRGSRGQVRRGRRLCLRVTWASPLGEAGQLGRGSRPAEGCQAWQAGLHGRLGPRDSAGAHAPASWTSPRPRGEWPFPARASIAGQGCAGGPSVSLSRAPRGPGAGRGRGRADPAPAAGCHTPGCSPSRLRCTQPSGSAPGHAGQEGATARTHTHTPRGLQPFIYSRTHRTHVARGAVQQDAAGLVTAWPGTAARPPAQRGAQSGATHGPLPGRP